MKGRLQVGAPLLLLTAYSDLLYFFVATSLASRLFCRAAAFL